MQYHNIFYMINNLERLTITSQYVILNPYNVIVNINEGNCKYQHVYDYKQL